MNVNTFRTLFSAASVGDKLKILKIVSEEMEKPRRITLVRLDRKTDPCSSVFRYHTVEILHRLDPDKFTLYPKSEGPSDGYPIHHWRRHHPLVVRVVDILGPLAAIPGTCIEIGSIYLSMKERYEILDRYQEKEEKDEVESEYFWESIRKNPCKLDDVIRDEEETLCDKPQAEIMKVVTEVLEKYNLKLDPDLYKKFVFNDYRGPGAGKLIVCSAQ